MQSSESSMDTVERRGRLNHGEFVERYRRPRRPVILTDAISHWPAVARWTPTYFSERVGGRRVEIDGGSYTVAQMIAMLDTSSSDEPAPYLRAQKVVDVFPELASDLEPPTPYSHTWNTIDATNWDDVAADTRKRVVRRVGNVGGAAFDIYASAVARMLKANRPRIPAPAA